MKKQVGYTGVIYDRLPHCALTLGPHFADGTLNHRDGDNLFRCVSLRSARQKRRSSEMRMLPTIALMAPACG
jgi:hypothetical protein